MHNLPLAASFVFRPSRDDGNYPLPPGFPKRPPLPLVSFDGVGERCQLALLGRAFDAAYQRVGAFHEQRVHFIGHLGQARHRLGRAVAGFLGCFFVAAWSALPSLSLVVFFTCTCTYLSREFTGCDRSTV